MNFIEWIRRPWPWYTVGPLIGLVVPLLLILGNKKFGVSSSLRHLCAACLPGNISYFKYDWKKEAWNLFFVAGILIGGYIAGNLLRNPQPMQLNPKLVSELQHNGINNFRELLPSELFSWSTLFTVKGLIMIVVGGFLVGFGTRYAGGCTSGHSIMGLSNLQWPSLVATMAFFTGGLIVANLILPYILKL